ADRRDEPARPVDADALQGLLTARIGLDCERAGVDRGLQTLRIALDDDVGDALLPEPLRDDAADAAVAADDEVILDRTEHTSDAPPLQPLRQSSLDDDRREQREG